MKSAAQLNLLTAVATVALKHLFQYLSLSFFGDGKIQRASIITISLSFNSASCSLSAGSIWTLLDRSGCSSPRLHKSSERSKQVSSNGLERRRERATIEAEATAGLLSSKQKRKRRRSPLFKRVGMSGSWKQVSKRPSLASSSTLDIVFMAITLCCNVLLLPTIKKKKI